MKRWLVVLGVVLAVALLFGLFAAVRLASRRASQAVTSAAAEATGGEQEPVENGPDQPPEVMRRLEVLLYYPAVDGDGLAGEPREIFLTTAPSDRAKQILADLISGPSEPTALRALPPGTQLRQVYVLDDGTAYVDFSPDLRQGLGGGSAGELFAVYAIVNSVALNIPEIRRVGILIDGEPIETLNGHVDLRRPLPPDTSIIVQGSQPRVVRAGGQ